jgi:streptogramin lyase
MIFRKLVLIVITLFALFASSVYAQSGGYVPFAWHEADLALLIPEGWSASAVLRDDQPGLEISSDDGLITLQVLSDTTADADLRPALDSALAALDVSASTYTQGEWFGRRALQAQGAGRVGWLPDQRPLVLAGRDVSQTTLNTIANSIVFSAESAPTPLQYALLWQTQIPEALNIEGAPVPPRLVGLAHSPFGQLYVVDATQGVIVLDPATGANIITFPFANPSQPNSIAVDPSGAVYVADTVCRCLQILANRTWLNPLGSFGGGAPMDVNAAPDGSLYTIDRLTDGYTVRILSNGTNRSIPLNFNGAAAPLLAVNAEGEVTVVEWLSSLIDGEINGAVSHINGDATALQYWLDAAPDLVNDIVGSPDGELVAALSDGRVALVNDGGALSELVREESTPRALAFAPDGTLYIAREDGAVVARSAELPPERSGDGTISNHVPVQGQLNENIVQQDWLYEGTAGEQITINAVDLTRTNTLDMAVRLTGPDGGERAYNDDQLGLDLYGRFDSQIADYVLRESGTYTISVEWVRGEGTYTLGVSPNRRFELSADSAARLEGTLQDVFPVQRWIFQGTAGQVVTFTMFAESGDLDPALELIQPGGSTMAYNDDAADPELGVNAQLFRVELPDDGIYVLEASRFEGSGRYSIVALLNQ